MGTRDVALGGAAWYAKRRRGTWLVEALVGRELDWHEGEPLQQALILDREVKTLRTSCAKRVKGGEGRGSRSLGASGY